MCCLDKSDNDGRDSQLMMGIVFIRMYLLLKLVYSHSFIADNFLLCLFFVE